MPPLKYNVFENIMENGAFALSKGSQDNLACTNPSCVQV